MKELEKFNAETTPFGTELITRDGREVTDWYYFKGGEGSFKVQAVINGHREGYTINGFFNSNESETDYDLFIKPKVKEIWVNVYIDKNGSITLGGIYDFKDNCISGINTERNYIKTIRITDEPE